MTSTAGLIDSAGLCTVVPNEEGVFLWFFLNQDGFLNFQTVPYVYLKVIKFCFFFLKLTSQTRVPWEFFKIVKYSLGF